MSEKGEREGMVAEIVALLRESQRYHEQDILNRYSGFAEADVRRALWKARETVREQDGIVFGVISGHPGNFHRLDYRQVADQARRQRAAGTRKHKRAEHKLRLAASSAPEQERERLNDAADRVALRVAMRAAKQVP